jgi:PAS domain S-box-containing protein
VQRKIVEAMPNIDNTNNQRGYHELTAPCEERLRQFADRALAAFAIFDRDMRYLYASDRWLKDYGLYGRELYGISHYDIFPEIPKVSREAHRRGLAGEKLSAENDRFERADGSVQWICWEIRPWHNATGEVGGIIIFSEDITERKTAEEALHSHEAMMHSIINSAMDAIISVDEDQRIIVFNRAAEKIFQCAASEALGSSLTRFLPAQYRDTHGEHLRKFGATGATSRSMCSPAVLTAVRANGEEFPIEATISQAQTGGKKTYTVILRDITERKRNEEALVRSEKLAAVGRVAATIAHEINNPLAAVTNTLFIAMRIQGLPESARQYLETADEELKRIAHITRQSLGFYRESKAPTPTSVTAVLDSAVDLLRSQTKAKQAVIEKQWDGDVQITAVKGELRQVFSNLLANSLDAIDDKGVVKLRVSTGTDFQNGRRYVRVTVADNGKGVDASLRHQIFEPFFTTKGTVGTGLGLWVSKQIVDKHGGTIRVRSGNNGKSRGTVFSVVLPVDAALDAARSQSAVA